MTFNRYAKRLQTVVHLMPISLGSSVFRIIILKLNWMHWRDYDFCLPSSCL